MHVSSVGECPRRAADGLVSHVLLQDGDAPGGALAVTWVEVAVGARQPLHRHAPEQVYVVVAGRGRMHVDGEARELERGQLARVPPGARHGIENVGAVPLVYLSCATPALRITDGDDIAWSA